MICIIHNLDTDKRREFSSLSDVPARHRWAFDEMAREEKPALIEGDTLYELREGERYDIAKAKGAQ